MHPQNASDPSELATGKLALMQTTGSKLCVPIRSVSGQPPNEETHSTTSKRDDQNETLEESKTRFSAKLIRRYNTRRLSSTTWKCKICGGQATELIHATASLPPDLGSFGSTVGDMLIPTCERNTCHIQGNAVAESFFENGLPNTERTNCENCGSESKMKLCAGCRFTRK
jgi:hypothetical protein